jgi:hypothetical protein
MPRTLLGRVRFYLFAAVCYILAMLAYLPPRRRMPVDFHFVLWVSLPLGVIWVLAYVAATWQCGKRTLWLLPGAPLALYWPVWLLLNHIPNCYWAGNCV